MLKFICSIPESVGWALVGVAGTFCLLMMVEVIKTICKAIKERKTNDDAELVEVGNDYDLIQAILAAANNPFIIEEVEGEHSGIAVPSPYPENYTTGVYFSFNEDGSLYSVHSYKPDDGEESEG